MTGDYTHIAYRPVRAVNHYEETPCYCQATENHVVGDEVPTRGAK